MTDTYRRQRLWPRRRARFHRLLESPPNLVDTCCPVDDVPRREILQLIFSRGRNFFYRKSFTITKTVRLQIKSTKRPLQFGFKQAFARKKKIVHTPLAYFVRYARTRVTDCAATAQQCLPVNYWYGIGYHRTFRYTVCGRRLTGRVIPWRYLWHDRTGRVKKAATDDRLRTWVD